MDWDKLSIFHAVADAGSFTHAGHDLGLSQSAVSRQISALEQDLKVPLFHRHARGLILTEQGEVLYRTAHDVFTKLAAAQTRLMDSKDKPTGELRVTTTVGLGSVWLTPRIAEFLELYPADLASTMLLDDRELDLAMREADVAIRLRRPTQPDLIQRKLFTVHYHAYASPEYLRRSGTPKALDDLDSIRSCRSARRRHIFGRQLARDRRPPRRRAAALGAQGQQCLWALQARVEAASRHRHRCPTISSSSESGLVQVDLPGSRRRRFDTYFVYPEELKESKRVAVFRDFIVSKAKEWKY